MAIQPFLRWAGSKRQILSTLEGYFPTDAKRYVEPFAGSACLFFRLEPKKALLSDINEDLVNVFNQIKMDPLGVWDALAEIKIDEREYYRLRSLVPELLSGPSRAARFIYLNRFCFNGLYRTNLKGQFNVPYGGNRSGSLPTKEDFLRYQSRLKNVTVICSDFGATLSKVSSGDFVYMDPPYITGNDRVFREYDRRNFGLKDLHRLRRWMDKLTEKSVRFVVSYSHGPESLALAKGYDLDFINVRRNIAGFASDRRSSREVLITNMTRIRNEK